METEVDAVVTWSDDEILTALCDWGWDPPGSEVVRTDAYRVTFRPPEWGGDADVQQVRAPASADDLIDEVHQLSRERGVARVAWHLYPLTTPADLRERLLARGGVVLDEGGLLALRVSRDGRLDVGPTDGVVTRLVRDVAGLTDYRRVVADVYDQPLASAGEITAEAAALPGVADTVGKFVAYLDDRPAGTGTVAVRDDGSASLFGVATHEHLRHRGVYRAILAARTAWAAAHGVPVLLVSGRRDTSFPIMKRIGFTEHGTTWTVQTTVDDGPRV